MHIEFITIVATNMLEMVAFYNKVFDCGLTPIDESKCYSGIFAGMNLRLCPNKGAGKVTHHQFRVAVADVAVFSAQLKAAGGEIINESTNGERKILVVRDIEANTYEIIQSIVGLKPANRPDRAKLEQAILTKEHAAKMFSDNFAWINSSAYTDYLKAWLELKRYYERHYDQHIRYIRCDVWHSFLRSTQLYTAILDTHEHLPFHEFFEDKLEFIEHTLDTMIAEGYMELHSTPKNTSDRADIEARIMEIEAQLNHHSAFSEDTLKDYLSAWADLADYYHDHAAPDCVYIRCDVLSAFLRTKSLLREMLGNRQYTNVHQQAQSGLTILEGRMNSILAVGESILKQPV